MVESVSRLIDEGLIDLRSARSTLPEPKPSRVTVWSWATHGIHDGKIKLEAVRCGRKLYTSRKAIERFIAAQNV